MTKKKSRTSSRQPPIDRPKQRKIVRAIVHRSEAREIATTPQPTKPQRIDMANLRDLLSRGRVTVSTREFGTSGTLNQLGRIYGEDYNPLFEPSNALRIFDQMERSDASCGAAVDIITLPIRAATFHVVAPKDATPKEKAITDTVQRWIFEPGAMRDSWDDTLRQMLSKTYMGFSLAEKLWTFDENEGLIRYKRLAPRLQRTVRAFHVEPDGMLRSVEQYAATPDTGLSKPWIIPAPYCVLNVRNKDGDNYFGRSVLRRAYKHWWYKDDASRIEGVRLDRYGVGIPRAKIAQNFALEDDDYAVVQDTLQSMRSHDQAWIIEPWGITFDILSPQNGQGGAAGGLDWIRHNDGAIVRSVLATFLADNSEGLNTNRTRTLADVFLHALKSEANAIAGTLQVDVVNPFCNVNFDMTDARPPAVRVDGLGDLTIEDLSKIVPEFVSAKVIQPDDAIEDVYRRLLNLPPLQEGWKRGEQKPAAPAVPDVGDPSGQDTTIQPDDSHNLAAVEAQIIGRINSLEELVGRIGRVVELGQVNGPKRATRLERDPAGKIIRLVHEQ